VDCVELILDESSLTGENRPVEKQSKSVSLGSNLSLVEQLNMVFCGTLVTSGHGRALVLAVGEETEFGKVAKDLGEVESRKSPLQIKIDELSQKLAALSSLAIGIIAVLGWFLGRPFLETVTVAVSLAVAAIPEGLPICVTVTLALGVLRMARRNAIVKKLPVVESLGCATAVASDKTGTLTQNEMTVRYVHTLAWRSKKFGFTGIGYKTSAGRLVQISSYAPIAPTSDSYVSESSKEMTALRPLFFTGCLCNNATLCEDDCTVESVDGTNTGQPTELAILVATAKASLENPRPQYLRGQEIPFTSERKKMEVKARPVNGVHVCIPFQNACGKEQSWRSRRQSLDGSLYFVKGMPERIIESCTTYVNAEGALVELLDYDLEEVLAQATAMAAQGLRVLAVAFGTSLSKLTYAGLLGMEDPPRPGVADSVRSLRQGGVKIIMVTGDARETALAIAKRCSIVGSLDTRDLGDLMLSPSSDDVLEEVEGGISEVLSGEDIDGIPVKDLSSRISDIKVFYRVSPRHKLQIVRACKCCLYFGCESDWSQCKTRGIL